MKNIITVCLIAFSTLLTAQKEIAWFDVGLKAMYGGSSILNSAVADASGFDYALTFGNSYSVGGKFGINRGFNGLALELMYNKGNASIQNLQEGQNDLEVDWNAIDIYALFRNNANLGFFEIGPKFSLLNSLERTTGLSGGVSENLKEGANGDQVNGLGISGVLSMGVLLLGNDRAFSGQIGLRFEYGFTDMIKEGALRDSFEPFPDLANQNVDYSKSAPIYAGIVFELNFGLGFYGISQCGGRPKLFGF